MSHKKANDEEPEAMSKDTFIAIFSSETKGSRINDVIAEDTFVSAMVDIVLLPLKNKDNYLPPYNNFKEADYMDELCKGLSIADVRKLRGRLFDAKYSKFFEELSSMHSFAAARDGINLTLNLCPSVNSKVDPCLKIRFDSITDGVGDTFPNLVQHYTNKVIKDNQNRAAKIVSFVDMALSVVPVYQLPPEIALMIGGYKAFSAVTPVLSNVLKANHYDKLSEDYKKGRILQDEQEVGKKDDMWVKNNFIPALIHKLKRRAKDKNTLYSMLKFAKNEKQKKQNK